MKMPVQPEEGREAKIAAAFSAAALVFYVKIYSANTFSHPGVELAVLIVIVANILTFMSNVLWAEVD